MTLRTGFPVALANGTAVDTGVVLAGSVVRDLSGNPRAGIFPRTMGALVSARSDLRVNFAAFEGVTSRAGQGVVFVANDAAVVSTPSVPVPTSNSWIVVAWVRHDDEFTPNTDGDSLPKFGFTEGVASPTPAKPAIPDGCLELATILVPSSATATNSTGVVITQTHLYTAMSGGRVVVRNAIERNAWAPADQNESIQVDTRQTWVRRGGAWVLSGGAAPWAQSLRNPLAPTGTDTYPANSPVSFTSLGFSAVIAAAPAGIYKVGGYIMLSAAGGDSNGNLRIQVTSAGNVPQNVNYDQFIKLVGGGVQIIPVNVFYNHPGGDLSVTALDQRANASATVYNTSQLSLAWDRAA
ncbi:hypothetical protein [Subtercola sp. RTI3]|uniref:hypothetical protein n=1 Tax=Subtercola sp. RTI3 TaxID=3048639 RepID=UPI002B234B9B|nr:hypothetical protein [Subtercola sp. RTI3]MEA9986295.1 hypothetical protein [Subtercola sp. RTI3]